VEGSGRDWGECRASGWGSGLVQEVCRDSRWHGPDRWVARGWRVGKRVSGLPHVGPFPTCPVAASLGYRLFSLAAGADAIQSSGTCLTSHNSTLSRIAFQFLPPLELSISMSPVPSSCVEFGTGLHAAHTEEEQDKTTTTTGDDYIISTLYQGRPSHPGIITTKLHTRRLTYRSMLMKH
jgi:hypothetical protein